MRKPALPDYIHPDKPFNPSEKIYAKVGLKYYFTENIFSSFILKTHYGVAEVMEFGIGYRF